MVDQCVLIGVKANMFKPEQVGKRTRYTYAKINEVNQDAAFIGHST